MHALLCTRTDVHRQKTLKMTTIDRFSGLDSDSKLKCGLVGQVVCLSVHLCVRTLLVQWCKYSCRCIWAQHTQMYWTVGTSNFAQTNNIMQINQKHSPADLNFIRHVKWWASIVRLMWIIGHLPIQKEPVRKFCTKLEVNLFLQIFHKQFQRTCNGKYNSGN